MKLGYLIDTLLVDFVTSIDEVELYSFRWKVGSTQQLLNCHVYAKPYHNCNYKIRCYSTGRYPQLVHDTSWCTLRECYLDLLEYSKQNQL